MFNNLICHIGGRLSLQNCHSISLITIGIQKARVQNCRKIFKCFDFPTKLNVKESEFHVQICPLRIRS